MGARGRGAGARTRPRWHRQLFRIDTRGIADALPEDDAEVLYDDRAVADVSAALDVLAARGFASAIVCGGCSGAFLGFAAGAEDPRVAGLVLVNPQRLVWHPGEDLVKLMKEGTRTVKGQASQALSLRQWRRLVTGELSIGRIARAVLRQVSGLVVARLVRLGLPVSMLARVRAEIVRRCASSMRAVPRSPSSMGRTIAGARCSPHTSAGI